MTVPSPAPLTQPQRERLVQIAREALQSRVRRGVLPQITEADPRLNEPRAVFTTLTYGDEVRGCMGSPHADLPLYRAVMQTVASAATDDPSQAPIRLHELHRLSVELTLLGPMVLCSAEALEPGVHGVLVQVGRATGILLPQVATPLGWDREQVLAEACARGGMARDAWRSESARIELFRAEVFSDYQVRLGEAT